MKYLQKFNEYYIVDPNFEAFKKEVLTIAIIKFKENKKISFKDLKNYIIESFGGMQQFKYGDDFSKKLEIINNVVSDIIVELEN